MKFLKLLLPVLGLVFLASSEGNAGGIFSKSKTSTAAPVATQKLQITKSIGVSVDPKALKDLQTILHEYQVYTKLKSTGAKDLHPAQKAKITKACNAKCKGGLGGLIGNNCKKTGVATACALMCPEVTIKNCMKSAKTEQGTILSKYKMGLDKYGVPKDRKAIQSESTSAKNYIAAKDATGNRKAAAVKAKAKRAAAPVVEEEDDTPELVEEDTETDEEGDVETYYQNGMDEDDAYESDVY